MHFVRIQRNDHEEPENLHSADHSDWHPVRIAPGYGHPWVVWGWPVKRCVKDGHEDRVVALEYLGEIGYLVQRNRVLVMDMLLQREPANVQKRNKELLGNVEKVTKIWAAYMATNLTPHEQTLADTFAGARKTYVQEGLLPVAQAMLANDWTNAFEIYTTKTSTMALATLEGAVKLNRLQLDEAKKEYDAAVARYAMLRMLMVGGIGAGILFAFAFGMALVRGISRQLGGEPGEAAELAAALPQATSLRVLTSKQATPPA